MKNHNPYILNGSLTKGVVTLSAPIIFAMFFHSLLNITDTFWVGKISAQAVAAVSISWPVVFILIALAAGISTGTNAVVAKFIGAKNIDQASSASLNSLFLGLIVSIIITIFGLLYAGWLFNFLGATGEMYELAFSYTNILFYGTIFLVIMFILGSILRGEGDTKIPMKIGIGINVFNMILDPVLIFGLGWGVNGAAIATVVSTFMGMILYLLYFRTGQSAVKLYFRKFKINLKLIKEILLISIPASLRNVTNAIGVFFIIKIIAVYGTAVVAAYGIAFRVESFGILPVVGIALSAVTLVGQNRGANNLKRAKLSGWVSIGISSLVMGIFGIVVYIFSSFIIKIFNNDPEVVMIGQEVLQIKSFSFMFSAIVMILSSAFSGFGKSHYSLAITIFRVILMISFAYWSNNIWGLVGVWWAVALTSVISAIVNIIWYQFYQPKEVEITQEI